MGSLSDKINEKQVQQYTETEGTTGSALVEGDADAQPNELLTSAGLDPKLWHIEGDIKVRRWQQYNGDYRFSYGFSVRQGETEEAKAIAVDDLADYLRNKPVRKQLNDTSGTDAYAFLASDWQLGKALGPVGSQETAQRVSDAIDQSVARVKELRKIGRKMPQGVIVGLGDIVESCSGHYPNIQFNIDLNQRDQNRIARELLRYAIDEHRGLFDEFDVICVGGNHGENRDRNNKITDDADNLDVEVFEVLKEAYDMAGINDINWTIPQGELSLAANLGGVNVGFTHGHLFKSGANAPAKAEAWFAKQVYGMQPVQHCRILVSGHFHHFFAYSPGRRSLIQTPAADPGSKWFTDFSGSESAAGVLTLRFDENHPLGYDDIAILGG